MVLSEVVLFCEALPVQDEERYAVQVSPEATHKIFLRICNDTTMLKRDPFVCAISKTDEIYLQIFLNNVSTMPDKNKTSYPKEKINILFLENISDTAVKNFTAAGYTNVRKLNGALSEEQLMNEIKNVHLRISLYSYRYL